MKDFILVDITHNKYAIKRLQICEVASLLRLYIGPNFTEEDVRKLWKYSGNYPCVERVKKLAKVSNIKWYIHTQSNKIPYDPEWHPDFLMGIIQWGQLFVSARSFPSFRWYGNYDILQALEKCPYKGKLNTSSPLPGRDEYKWSFVPALCFSYSTDSIEFMAGVLSTGLISNKGNFTFTKYNRHTANFIRSWGIPIEYEDNRNVYISPIWGILLKKYMPKIIKEKWDTISDPYRAQEYAAILWKIYINKDPIVNAIPYLKSRRTIYYKYASMKRLRELWVENKMVELDTRFKKVIEEWQQNFV